MGSPLHPEKGPDSGGEGAGQRLPHGVIAVGSGGQLQEPADDHKLGLHSYLLLTKISALNSNVEPIELPETAQRTLVDFDFDYRDYFNGSIERIEILCSYSAYHNMSIPYFFTKANAKLPEPAWSSCSAFPTG